MKRTDEDWQDNGIKEEILHILTEYLKRESKKNETIRQ